MRKNNETRRGANLGRAPERVCSPADAQKTNRSQEIRQLYVIRLFSEREYLSFVPNVYAPGSPQPIGKIELTRDLLKAVHSPDKSAALAFLNKYSNVLPCRPDGKPHKPVRAMIWTFEAVLCEPRAP